MLIAVEHLGHSVFALESFDGIDVFFLRVGGGLALERVPGVPLGLARKVHHTRARCVAITNCSLLKAILISFLSHSYFFVAI